MARGSPMRRGGSPPTPIGKSTVSQLDVNKKAPGGGMVLDGKATLHAQNAALQRQRAQAAELHDANTDLRSENEKLIAKNTAFQNEVTRLKAQITALREGRNRLRENNVELHDQTTKLYDNITVLQSQVRALREKNATLREKNTGLNDASAGLRGENKHLHQQTMTLQRHVADHARLRTELESRVGGLLKLLDEAKTQLKRETDSREIDTLLENIEAERGASDALRQRCRQATRNDARITKGSMFTNGWSNNSGFDGPRDQAWRGPLGGPDMGDMRDMRERWRNMGGSGNLNLHGDGPLDMWPDDWVPNGGNLLPPPDHPFPHGSPYGHELPFDHPRSPGFHPPYGPHGVPPYPLSPVHAAKKHPMPMSPKNNLNGKLDANGLLKRKEPRATPSNPQQYLVLHTARLRSGKSLKAQELGFVYPGEIWWVNQVKGKRARLIERDPKFGDMNKGWVSLRTNTGRFLMVPLSQVAPEELTNLNLGEASSAAEVANSTSQALNNRSKSSSPSLADPNPIAE